VTSTAGSPPASAGTRAARGDPPRHERGRGRGASKSRRRWSAAGACRPWWGSRRNRGASR